MSTQLETQRIFLLADKKSGRKVVGADVTMVISGYEHLTFYVKTNGLPMFKDGETVDYSTTHGVKTAQTGYIQTLNEIQVTFMENDALTVKNALEEIKLDGKNGKIDVNFFLGRTIEETNHWGKMEYVIITTDDNPEGDSESVTTPLTITATLKGHYIPSGVGGVISDIKTALNIIK